MLNLKARGSGSTRGNNKLIKTTIYVYVLHYNQQRYTNVMSTVFPCLLTWWLVVLGTSIAVLPAFPCLLTWWLVLGTSITVLPLKISRVLKFEMLENVRQWGGPLSMWHDRPVHWIIGWVQSCPFFRMVCKLSCCWWCFDTSAGVSRLMGGNGIGVVYASDLGSNRLRFSFSSCKWAKPIVDIRFVGETFSTLICMTSFRPLMKQLTRNDSLRLVTWLERCSNSH